MFAIWKMCLLHCHLVFQTEGWSTLGFPTPKIKFPPKVWLALPHNLYYFSHLNGTRSSTEWRILETTHVNSAWETAICTLHCNLTYLSGHNWEAIPDSKAKKKKKKINMIDVHFDPIAPKVGEAANITWLIIFRISTSEFRVHTGYSCWRDTCVWSRNFGKLNEIAPNFPDHTA